MPIPTWTHANRPSPLVFLRLQSLIVTAQHMTTSTNDALWSSHRQSVVAQSSTESEWYAAADVAKEAEFLRNLFSDLGMPQNGAIPMLCEIKVRSDKPSTLLINMLPAILACVHTSFVNSVMLNDYSCFSFLSVSNSPTA